jgi:hypothetical protein
MPKGVKASSSEMVSSNLERKVKHSIKIDIRQISFKDHEVGITDSSAYDINELW